MAAAPAATSGSRAASAHPRDRPEASFRPFERVANVRSMLVTIPAARDVGVERSPARGRRLADAGGNLVQVVLVDDSVAVDIPQQPVEVVHGDLAVGQFDVDFVIAVGGRRVGVAADAVRAEVKLDRVIDHVDIHAGKRDGRLARGVAVEIVLVERDIRCRRAEGLTIWVSSPPDWLSDSLNSTSRYRMYDRSTAPFSTIRFVTWSAVGWANVLRERQIRARWSRLEVTGAVEADAVERSSDAVLVGERPDR